MLDAVPLDAPTPAAPAIAAAAQSPSRGSRPRRAADKSPAGFGPVLPPGDLLSIDRAEAADAAGGDRALGVVAELLARAMRRVA